MEQNKISIITFLRFRLYVFLKPTSMFAHSRLPGFAAWSWRSLRFLPEGKTIPTRINGLVVLLSEHYLQ